MNAEPLLLIKQDSKFRRNFPLVFRKRVFHLLRLKALPLRNLLDRSLAILAHTLFKPYEALYWYHFNDKKPEIIHYYVFRILQNQASVSNEGN